MISGASFLYGKELIVSSKWYGKLSIVLLYTAMVLSLLLRSIKQFNIPTFLFTIDKVFYGLAIVSTIFSLLMYIKAFYVQGYLKKAIKGK